MVRCFRYYEHRMSSIISIDDLNDYMIKSLTPIVAQQVVDAVNAYIESKTNRSWGETAEAVERHDWKLVIYLRHQDVVDVSSIHMGYPGRLQSTLDANSYFVNQRGRLTFFSYGYGGGGLVGNPRYHDWLEITYTYGVLNVPDDLKLAALGVASGFYNWATNGQKDVVSSQVGSYRVEFSGAVRGGATPNPATSTADANWAVIDSYRTRHI